MRTKWKNCGVCLVSKLAELVEKPLSGEWGQPDINGNGIPVLRTTNFTNVGIINFDNVTTRIINEAKAKNKFLRHGDTLIEKSGGSPSQPVGRVVYFDGENNKYIFNNFTSVLRPKNDKRLYSKFLFYALFAGYQQGKTKRFQNKTTGILNLKFDRFLNETDIPLPPKSEQCRMVATLDAVSNLLSLRKQKLAGLDKLIQSVFYDMFGDPITNEKGWNKKLLKEVCDVRDGTHDSPKYVKEGYPLISSKNLSSGKLDFGSVYLISQADFDAINKRSKVDSGDILMPMIGTIGNPSIVDTHKEFAIKNVALLKFSNSQLSDIFVKVLLSSEFFDVMTKRSNRGGTQKFIALSDIRDLNIPVPPIALQNQFASMYQKVEEEKALVQQSIDETQEIFDSLMNQYFE